MRTQFAFYKSFDDVYQDLNDSQKLEFISILLDVQFLRIRVDDVVFMVIFLWFIYMLCRCFDKISHVFLILH